MLTPEEEADQFFDQNITFKTRKVNMLYEVVYIKPFNNGYKLATETLGTIPTDEEFDDSQVYLSLDEALLNAHKLGLLVKLL